METKDLIHQLSQDTGPVQPAMHPYARCIRWLLGLVAYMTLMMVFFHPRPDILHKLASPLFLAETGSLFLIAAASALSAALLNYPDMMQKKWLAFAPVASFALFIMVILLALRADNPPAPPPDHEAVCTIAITLFALLPAFWIFSGMRGSASTHTGFSGITATLCAFSIGALTLRFAEQTDSIPHLIEWHYLPILALSMAGAWVGKKLLRW